MTFLLHRPLVAVLAAQKGETDSCSSIDYYRVIIRFGNLVEVILGSVTFIQDSRLALLMGCLVHDLMDSFWSSAHLIESVDLWW